MLCGLGRGISSVGRAPALQAGGHRFEPGILHKVIEMILEILENRVKFLTDRKGKRTHAVLPIKQYRELLENLHDNIIADSREEEGTIDFTELTMRLKND